MQITISGLGDVGTFLANMLVQRGFDLTIIDVDQDKCQALEEQLDASIIHGSGTRSTILDKAAVQTCDLFLSLTFNDEVNLVSASLAKAMGSKRVMARCHSSSFRENSFFPYAEHFNIDYFIRPDRLAATRLAQQIRNPKQPIIDQFARGTVDIQQALLHSKSPALGKTLAQLRLPSKVRVGLIHRGHDTWVPGADTILTEGDELTLIGELDSIKTAFSMLAQQTTQKKKRLVIYGASDIGLDLVEYFSPLETDIKLIEPDLERCEEIYEIHPWIKVIHGQATSSQLLLEENIMEADVFVAATREDENNVMACLQAVKYGIRPCLLTIHRHDYAGILTDIGDILGINSIVSPRLVTGNEILRYTTNAPYIILWELTGKGIIIIELRLTRQVARVYGMRVKELPSPKATLILAIERSNQTIVPTAEDTIERGDSLFILTTQESRQHVLDMFDADE